MGSFDVSLHFSGHMSREELIDALEERQGEIRGSEGDDFNLPLYLHFSDRIFTDLKEAYDYCISSTPKDSMTAVRVLNKSKDIWLVAGWEKDNELN
jgi:hypothetical protein